MRRENKVWGERWLCHQDTTHSTAILHLKKGFRCSWHKHEQKYNLFVVLFGKIEIVTLELEGIKRTTILTKGNSFTVMPGQYHEFRILEDSIVLEEMYVYYCEEDIQRQRLGGMIPDFFDKEVENG